ncbi:MAG: hypothetical protein ACI4SG_01445 [Oligosphaeraceae bacterium]
MRLPLPLGLTLLWLLGIFFLPGVCLGAEEEKTENSWEGQWAQAMETSRHATLTCALQEKELLENFLAESGRYSQFGLAGGGVLRKMEFFRKGGESLLVLLETDQGVFGSFEGRWFALEDFPVLRHFHRMWEPLPARELALGHWTRKEGSYQNRKIWRYQFSVIQDGKTLQPVREMPLLAFSSRELEDVNSGFYRRMPFYYVFQVDQKTGLVLSRSEVDIRGAVLSRKTLAGTDFTTGGLLPSDFQPGKVENPGELLSAEVFLRKFQESRMTVVQSRREQSSWQGWWRRFRRSPLGSAGALLGGVALLFLGAALWLVRRNRGQ